MKPHARLTDNAYWVRSASRELCMCGSDSGAQGGVAMLLASGELRGSAGNRGWFIPGREYIDEFLPAGFNH